MFVSVLSIVDTLSPRGRAHPSCNTHVFPQLGTCQGVYAVMSSLNFKTSTVTTVTHHSHDCYHLHTKELLYHFTLAVFGVFMSQPIKSTVRIFPPAAAAWSTRANRWHTREHFCSAPAEAAFLKRCIFITTQHLARMLQIRCINLRKTKRDKQLQRSECNIWQHPSRIFFFFENLCVPISTRYSVISTCFMLYNCQMGWGLQTLQTHSCGHFNSSLCVRHQVIMSAPATGSSLTWRGHHQVKKSTRENDLLASSTPLCFSVIPFLRPELYLYSQPSHLIIKINNEHRKNLKVPSGHFQIIGSYIITLSSRQMWKKTKTIDILWCQWTDKLYYWNKKAPFNLV